MAAPGGGGLPGDSAPAGECPSHRDGRQAGRPRKHGGAPCGAARRMPGGGCLRHPQPAPVWRSARGRAHRSHVQEDARDEGLDLAAAAPHDKGRRPVHGCGAGVREAGVVAGHPGFRCHRRVKARLDGVAGGGGGPETGESHRSGGVRQPEHGGADGAPAKVLRLVQRKDQRLHQPQTAGSPEHARRKGARGDQVADPERDREHREEHSHGSRQAAYRVDDEPVDRFTRADGGT